MGAVLGLVACGPEVGPDLIPPTPQPEPEVVKEDPTPPSGGGVPESAAAFREDRVDTWSISITPEDWETLQRTALEEEYVPATLIISGEDVGLVGIRYKGSFGTLAGCFDATGQQVCPKLSMKVKFDKYEKGKRWKGLKRINLHSLMRDPSLLHERLGYQMFREMGLAAPRSVHGEVILNGEPLGVFAVTEQIDGRFTADRWPQKGDGNLYKEVWPITDNPAYYASGLKTNEDENPSHDKFVAFAQALAGATTEQLPELLDKWGGLDHLFRYLAVDQAIASWDGITAFYCDPNGEHCENHNFYFYQAEDGDRFWLVPWDLDFSFSLSHGAGLSPHGFDEVPAWNAPPADCGQRFWVWSDSVQVAAPGCDPLLRGVAAAGHPGYSAAMAELLDGPFKLQKVLADVDRWAAQLDAAVRRDPHLDYDSWQWNLRALRRDLETLRLRAELLRDGRTPGRFGLSLDAVNDFEAVDGYALSRGTFEYSDSDSVVRVGLNTDAPLAGAADTRIDFEFRDGGTTGAWGHWAEAHLRFGDAPKDLNGKAAIRLQLRSNVERTVRVELGSEGYLPGTTGRMGWQVKVPAGGATFTLRLDEAVFPSWVQSQGETREEVLARMTSLAFSPDPVGRTSDGRFPEGESDQGFLQLDDVRFE